MGIVAARIGTFSPKGDRLIQAPCGCTPMEQQDVYQFQNQLPVSLIIGFIVLFGVTVHVDVRGANLVARVVEVDHIDAVAGPAPVKKERIALVKDEPLVCDLLGNQPSPYQGQLFGRE